MPNSAGILTSQKPAPYMRCKLRDCEVFRGMFIVANCPERLTVKFGVAKSWLAPTDTAVGSFVLAGDGSVDCSQLQFSADHVFKAVCSGAAVRSGVF